MCVRGEMLDTPNKYEITIDLIPKSTIMFESISSMGRSFEDQKQVQFNQKTKLPEHVDDQKKDYDSMSLDNVSVFTTRMLH